MEKTAHQSCRKVEITSSPHFLEFLDTHKISIGLTTYQTNRLFLIGLKPDNTLSTFERLFDRPMGLHVESNRLFLATRFQVWQLDNILETAEVDKGYDCLFVPRVGYTIGDLDVHDLSLNNKQRPLFVNTLYSCLATISDRHSFDVVWKPSFISRLLPEDRCHLNGLAMENDQPRYVTAVSRSDVAAGWRAHRNKGGILIDIDSNEIISDFLSMPHSPRLYRGKLWVLNAGTGELGHVDCRNGQFNPLTFCPGYLRGLAFHDHFALVALSLPRYENVFSGLPLDKSLTGSGVDAVCGIMVIDLETGMTVHWLRFEGGLVTELYDVQVLSGVRCPSLLGFVNDQVKHTITFTDQSQIVRHILSTAKNDSSNNTDISKMSNETPSTVSQRVIVMRLILSSQEVVDKYAGLTYPSITKRLAAQQLHEPLYCSLLIDNNQLVGMAVAEIGNDGTAFLISFMVRSSCRKQGFGTRLIRDMEQQMCEQSVTALSVQYRTNWRACAQLERILRKCHWSEPVLHSLQCRTDIEHISKAPWVQKNKLPAKFSIFPWAEISDEERQQILDRTDYPPFLTPFQEEERIVWSTSFGLRKNGHLIGWLVTHRTQEDTVQYTCLFIEPGHRHAACGLNLLATAICNQIKLKIPFFIFMINAGNNAGRNLTNRRIVPYLLSAVETKYCTRSLPENRHFVQNRDDF